MTPGFARALLPPHQLLVQYLKTSRLYMTNGCAISGWQFILLSTRKCQVYQENCSILIPSTNWNTFKNCQRYFSQLRLSTAGETDKGPKLERGRIDSAVICMIFFLCALSCQQKNATQLVPMSHSYKESSVEK